MAGLPRAGRAHAQNATSAGVPAFISGGNGAIPEAWDGIGRQDLTVGVDPARLDFGVAVVRVD